MNKVIIRLADILFALAFISLVSPLWVFVVITLLFTGEGKVIYKQLRVGKQGKSFELLKFATMRSDSPNIGTGELTTYNDPRVLPFGKFLRKTKINETPQFVNVLLGQMSIVGPRPQTPFYLSVFTEEVQEKVKEVKPGITGVGSIIFRDEEELIKDIKDPKVFDIDVIVPYKGLLELWYVNNKSLKTYILIIFLTAYSVLFPKNQLYTLLLKDLPCLPAELARLMV